jgi:hypothetical protein
MKISRNQKMAECPSIDFHCFSDKDCNKKNYPEINTDHSKCMTNPDTPLFKTCTIKQWCLEEGEKEEDHIFEKVLNFNIVMQSSLLFEDEIISSTGPNGT